jgi:hypothetical protein
MTVYCKICNKIIDNSLIDRELKQVIFKKKGKSYLPCCPDCFVTGKYNPILDAIESLEEDEQ